MRGWRLSRRKYSALNGEGARLYGGRWNSIGRAVVYMSSHISLAVLELLVHTDSDLIPNDLEVFEIEIPDAISLETIDPARLPPDWRTIPNHPECQLRGDAWLVAGTSAVLAVPSAVVPEEMNYLLNPLHPDAGLVHVIDSQPFTFDPRLLPTSATTRKSSGRRKPRKP